LLKVLFQNKYIDENGSQTKDRFLLSAAADDKDCET
jgi:hypothetical protein